MLEWIYNIVVFSQLILVVMLIVKYVFLEASGWKYDRWFFGIYLTLVCAAALFFKKEDVWIVLFLMTPGIYILLSRKKKRLQGFFLSVPVFGIIFGLWMPGEVVLQLLFSEKVVDVVSVVTEMISCLAIIIFLWRGKQWRLRFHQEMEYRRLKKWEKRLLVWCGWLLFLVFMPLIEEPALKQLNTLRLET